MFEVSPEGALGQLSAGEQTSPATLIGILGWIWHPVCGQSSTRGHSCLALVTRKSSSLGMVKSVAQGRGADKPSLSCLGSVGTPRGVHRTGELVLRFLHTPATG